MRCWPIYGPRPQAPYRGVRTLLPHRGAYVIFGNDAALRVLGVDPGGSTRFCSWRPISASQATSRAPRSRYAIVYNAAHSYIALMAMITDCPAASALGCDDLARTYRVRPRARLRVEILPDLASPISAGLAGKRRQARFERPSPQFCEFFRHESGFNCGSPSRDDFPRGGRGLRLLSGLLAHGPHFLLPGRVRAGVEGLDSWRASRNFQERRHWIWLN